MSTLKTTLGNGTATHAVTDPYGNAIVLKQHGAPANAVATVGTASNFIVLSQQNVTDLLTALAAFSATGRST
jgi:hypothetical protein